MKNLLEKRSNMDFKYTMKKNGSDHNPCGTPLFAAPQKFWLWIIFKDQ